MPGESPIFTPDGPVVQDSPAPAASDVAQDDPVDWEDAPPPQDETPAVSPVDEPFLPIAPPAPATPAAQPAADDVEALGRMLASEDHRPAVQVVIGWYAVQHARRAHKTVFQLLTGRSGQYGHQKDYGEVRYASTEQAATPQTRELARQLLSGQVQPSAQIRAHGVSAWVEKGVGGYTALKILARQTYQTTTAKHKAGDKDFGGIWGRLAGTNWFLYGQREPVLVPAAQTEDAATATLAAVPQIPATDAGAAVA